MGKSHTMYAVLDVQTFLIVGVLSIIANSFDWWNGDGDASMLTQHETSEFEIGVWKMSLTILRDAGSIALGEVPTYEADWTWAQACEASKELSARGQAPAACLQVEILQWLTVLVPCFSFLAALAMSISLLTSELVMVLGVMCGAAGSVCALFGAIMPLVIQTKGVGGPGFAIFVIAAVVIWAGTAHAAQTATKAMPGPQEEPTTYAPRIQRSRASHTKTEEEHAQITSGIARGRREPPSERGPASDGSEGAERVPPEHLQQVLFWSKNQDHGDVGTKQSVPTEMLELAFQEIDGDNSGFIIVDELVEALHMCGLNAHPKAVETIISEMDANNSGDIDIVEFVDFFRQIEELALFQHKTKARAQFCGHACNMCFLLNLVGVFSVIMVFIGIKEADDPDLYNLVRSALIVMGVAFAVLFLTVVGLPVIRLSLGSHVSGWMYAYEVRGNKLKTLKPVQAAEPEVVVETSDAERLRQAVAQRHLALPPMPRTRGVLQEQQRFAEPPGVIADPEGNFVRYDPAAYSRAAMKALEARPRSFTPFCTQHVQDRRAELERGPKALTNGANQWTASPWTTTPKSLLNAQANPTNRFSAAASASARAVEDGLRPAAQRVDEPPLPPGGPSPLHLEDALRRVSEAQSEAWNPTESAERGRGTMQSEALQSEVWSAARSSMESDPQMLG